MKTDPEEFRHRYDELTDEALVAIDRDELVDLARQLYDDELERRGLRARPSAGFEVAEMDEELVTVATFLYAEEAKLARALLQSASIRCYLGNEHTLSIIWIWTYAFGGLRLIVPISAADEVREILDSFAEDAPVSEAEVWTPPGPKEDEKFSMIRVIDPKGRGRRWLLILILFLFAAPDAYRLYLFIVF